MENKNTLTTTDRRLFLFNLARQHEGVIEAFPGLSPSRVLNRLHALGVACTTADVEEALALVATTPWNSQGLSAGTAADSIGLLTRAEFNRLVASGFPVGMPVPHSLSKGDRLVYDALDLQAIRRWVALNPRREDWVYPDKTETDAGEKTHE